MNKEKLKKHLIKHYGEYYQEAIFTAIGLYMVFGFLRDIIVVIVGLFFLAYGLIAFITKYQTIIEKEEKEAKKNG